MDSHRPFLTEPRRTRITGMIVKTRLTIFLCLASSLLRAAEPVALGIQPGQSHYGQNQYIEYLAGNLPVILSAPHGGRERPSDIPDREQGTFAFDTNTQELAR